MEGCLCAVNIATTGVRFKESRIARTRENSNILKWTYKAIHYAVRFAVNTVWNARETELENPHSQRDLMCEHPGLTQAKPAARCRKEIHAVHSGSSIYG